MLAWTLLIVAVVALLLLNTAGVVLTALQMPGNWLILAATGLFAWYRWGADSFSYSRTALITLLALALFGELLEFLAGAMGSKVAGGTKRAAALSVVGAVIGAIGGTFTIPVPIVGTLLGAAIGAGLGSVAGDRWAGRDWNAAFRGGQGAAIGKLSGAAAKLAVSLAMWLTAATALLL
jgi:uncharacterized protein YqgC (DUF456 family)